MSPPFKITTMIPNYDEPISNFKRYLTQLGYGKGTVYMLPRLAHDFLNYSKTNITELVQEHIINFYEWLQIRPNKIKGGGLSETHIYHHIYALRMFFNWLEETGQITYNPISAMKFKRPKANKREPLSKEEINQLFETAQSLKETAILHLFYSCGLRRFEGEKLNIKDIHFKTQMLYVRSGKGAKRRAIPMTLKVVADLESYYLTERSSIKICHDTEAFILNRMGRRMNGSSYNKLLKSIIEKSKITNHQEITLHHLRHSIATHLLESGLTVEFVRDFLGHIHLESTQIYVKVSKAQLHKL